VLNGGAVMKLTAQHERKINMANTFRSKPELGSHQRGRQDESQDSTTKSGPDRPEPSTGQDFVGQCGVYGGPILAKQLTIL
jgi:hypothetical protein